MLFLFVPTNDHQIRVEVIINGHDTPSVTIDRAMLLTEFMGLFYWCLRGAHLDGKKSNLLIGFLYFILQSFNRLFLFLYQFQPRVLVNNGYVTDVLCSTSIVQCTYVFIKKVIQRRQTCNHQGVAIAAKGLSQYRGQL